MDGFRVKHQGELRRLLRYVRPYSRGSWAEFFCSLLMGAADGLVALSIRPLLDVVLNPHSSAQKLPLFTLPWTDHTFNLNSLVPSRIHHVWTVFAIAIVLLFFVERAGRIFRQHADSVCGPCRRHGSSQPGLWQGRAAAGRIFPP